MTKTKEITTGRPTKLTPQIIDEIEYLVGGGNYISTACQAVGINHQTYYNWLERGEKGEEPYFAFVEALKRAEAKAEAARVARVEAAGIGGNLMRKKTITKPDGTVIEDEQWSQPQWLADMTHLERRHPDRWGRKDRTSIDVNERKSITITRVEVVLNQGEGVPVIEGEAREIPRLAQHNKHYTTQNGGKNSDGVPENAKP